MIIHKKVKQYDNSYRSYNNQIFSIEKIFKKYNNDDIGYTFQDFLKDFGDKYKNYVEIKTVFNILLKGVSPSSYLTSNFYNSLVKGFNYNIKIVKEDNLKKLLAVLEIECDLKSYNLIIEKYKKHIELYGEKEKLEKFKEDYKIEEPVLYEKYKEKWHLAFDGILAEYLRKIS